MRECTAYIPCMSCEDSKRARHRQRQAAYEARVRVASGCSASFCYRDGRLDQVNRMQFRAYAAEATGAPAAITSAGDGPLPR
jgi:hypothetical protein